MRFHIHTPRIFLLLMVVLASAAIARAEQIVPTLARLAGGPTSERGAVDGDGDEARFSFPTDVSLSGDGSFALIADAQNSTIRRINIATREVITVAGLAGQRGTADGTGATARFAYPSGVATSADGTFALVADTDNHTIRRLDLATGLVTTLAGNASTAGTTDGVGNAARFNAPADLAISAAGTFALVADTDNHSIRRIDLASGAVTTLAGNNGVPGIVDDVAQAAHFRFPRGVAISADGGRAAVADSDNHTIRLIDLASGAVSTLAGSAGIIGAQDGTATSARFAFPRGVSFAQPDVLLVADFSNSTIRRIDLASGTVTTLLGSAGETGNADRPGNAARLHFPAAISSADSTTLVADTYNHTIRLIGSATLQERAYLPLVGR